MKKNKKYDEWKYRDNPGYMTFNNRPEVKLGNAILYYIIVVPLKYLFKNTLRLAKRIINKKSST